MAAIDDPAIQDVSTRAADSQGLGIAAGIVCPDNPAETQLGSARLAWLLDRAGREAA